MINMKNKFIVLLVSLVFLVSTAKSQDKKVKIGLMGSGAVSWLKPNNDGNYGYKRQGLRMGYTAGIGLDFALFGSNNYAFSTGVNLMQIGGKLDYPDVVAPSEDVLYTGRTTATYNLRYVDVPLTLKLKTNEIGYLTYFGQVGLGLGVNIRARQNWQQTYINGKYEPSQQDLNISDQIFLFRVPLIVAAGVEYNLSGNTSMIIGAQFNNGFTNVFTKKAPLYEVNDAGDIVTDSNGNPVKTNQKRNALTNFVALNLGIFF
jgi:hypothetical protein